ncbi:winged helix-turn-helix domain-containing protein [Streptomyces netropsis]|uniref:winged helix-turn-helix domain-containing protein n=1 Tax=Streptomyces netropsis TaxID=55404 RepID=UPI0037920262
MGRKSHVSYSVSGATRLMRRLGFTPQMPALRVADATSRRSRCGKRRPGRR